MERGRMVWNTDGLERKAVMRQERLDFRKNGLCLKLVMNLNNYPLRVLQSPCRAMKD